MLKKALLTTMLGAGLLLGAPLAATAAPNGHFLGWLKAHPATAHQLYTHPGWLHDRGFISNNPDLAFYLSVNPDVVLPVLTAPYPAWYNPAYGEAGYDGDAAGYPAQPDYDENGYLAQPAYDDNGEPVQPDYDDGYDYDAQPYAYPYAYPEPYVVPGFGIEFGNGWGGYNGSNYNGGWNHGFNNRGNALSPGPTFHGFSRGNFHGVNPGNLHSFHSGSFHGGSLHGGGFHGGGHGRH